MKLKQDNLDWIFDPLLLCNKVRELEKRIEKLEEDKN